MPIPSTPTGGFSTGLRSSGNVDLDNELLQMRSDIDTLKQAPAATTTTAAKPTTIVSPLPAISPAQSVTDIAATAVVGILTSYAREDHAHDGVSSVNGMQGDVTVSPGAIVTPYDNGPGGTALTIDWNNGINQKVTLDVLLGCTFTFINPAAGQLYTVEFIQNNTGGNVVILPASVKFGSISNSFTTTANMADLLQMYYNGASYVVTSHNSGYIP